MDRFPFPIFLTLLLIATVSGAAIPKGHHRGCEWIRALPKEKRPRIRSKNARNIILFTDANLDDIVSLLFLTKSVKSKLLAIYIKGNGWANAGSGIRNFYNILHMLGAEFDDIPIYLGSYYAIKDELIASETGQPIKLRYRSPIPSGRSGLLFADTAFGMAPFLPQGPNVYDIRKTPDEDVKSIPAFFEFVKSLPKHKKLTFISLGTLTPIAKMFGDDYVDEMENILSRVSRLVVMGGAVDVVGNLISKPTNLKAEFNIYNDPHAAQWAFANLTGRGVPVILVPLDATNDVPLQEQLLQTLRNSPKTPEAQLTGRLMENLRDTWFDPDVFFETAFLWDPSASIVAVHPKVVTERKKRYIRVVIEQGVDGPEQGWTKPCDEMEIKRGKCSLVTVVSGLNADLVTDILLSTLQGRRNSARFPLVCL